MNIVPAAFAGGVGSYPYFLVTAVDFQSICREHVLIEGQFTVFIDVPGLAVDVEGGWVEGDVYAVGHGLYPGRDIGRVERLIGAGSHLQVGLIIGRPEMNVRRRKMEAVAELYITDGSLHGKAVQVAATFKDQLVEGDVFITKRRQIHVQIEQVIAGIDTATDGGIVKTFEVLVEQVDVVFYFFGGNDETKVLIDGDGFGRLDVTGIIFIEKGLKGSRQIFDGEFPDDGAVKFIADNGDSFVIIDNAGFEGQGVKGNAPAILKD